MIKVCLIGIGKTGKEIAKMLLNQTDMRLVAALSSPGSMNNHKDLGEVIGIKEVGVKIQGTHKLDEILIQYRPDVVVDFSNSGATLKNAKIISRLGVNMVIGTTGFSEIELEEIKNLTSRNRIGIIYAPNITPGVNVLMTLTKLAAVLLHDYDFQITEIHHNRKKDIPSGTALKIFNEIQDGLLLFDKSIDAESVPINSVRAGGIIGKHEVLIAGEYDKITISHESFSRKAFANGALRAIRFINEKTGFYEMKDVLSLSKIIENLYLDNTNREIALSSKESNILM
jgi:4-hydroxy-tetrahydrodipicolinate reductase